MKKQLFAAAVILAASVVPMRGESGSSRASSRGDIIEQVLVKVNGDIITKLELEQQQVLALRQKMQVQKIDPESLKNDETLKKALAEVTPAVIANAIDQILLIQRGRELGLKLSDDQFKQIVNNIRKEQGFTDDAKWAEVLQQENMTMDALRKQLENQMLVDQVQRQEIGSKLSITEEEARQYYARHPEEFTEAASVTLREIFIEVPAGTGGINVAQDDEAKKKIEDVRARALKGEDFAKLAADMSTSPSKANGGLIGPFSHADMSPQLLALVEKMKPGDLTNPIRTAKGYQLFKLESLKPQALQPFDSVRDLIADKVAGARTQVEMRKFLTRLRAQAIIEWKNEELKKAYEKYVAADPVSSGQ
jgi:peptidyl-prolyl cis-trans isomerase SurA